MFLFSHIVLDPKDPIPELRTTCSSGKGVDQEAKDIELALLVSCVC